MDLQQITKDTAKVLTSYLTYQAVRTVVTQLSETNPPLAIWLNGFSSTDKIQDGEAYLRELLQADQELALRIMTVRAHLAEEVAGFLPEMVRTGTRQANMEHRRQYLEQLTQLHTTSDDSSSDPGSKSESNLDNLSD
ncbi:MAG: RbcX chaperonin protein [Cyanobacteria bacterium QH_9_48_43]|nr:MAG: RbcX chaperonin protein [Cyanobacteria bacterium QH_9_48_43]